MVTRQRIVSEMMKLVAPALVPMERRPTIEELENILAADNVPPIHIQPDGSILTEKPHTVGDIADVVMGLINEDVQAERTRCDGILKAAIEEAKRGMVPENMFRAHVETNQLWSRRYHELESLLVDACQLIDGKRQEAKPESWTEWDQTIRDRLTDALRPSALSTNQAKAEAEAAEEIQF